LAAIVIESKIDFKENDFHPLYDVDGTNFVHSKIDFQGIPSKFSTNELTYDGHVIDNYTHAQSNLYLQSVDISHEEAIGSATRVDSKLYLISEINGDYDIDHYRFVDTWIQFKGIPNKFSTNELTYDGHVIDNQTNAKSNLLLESSGPSGETDIRDAIRKTSNIQFSSEHLLGFYDVDGVVFAHSKIDFEGIPNKFSTNELTYDGYTIDNQTDAKSNLYFESDYISKEVEAGRGERIETKKVFNVTLECEIDDNVSIFDISLPTETSLSYFLQVDRYFYNLGLDGIAEISATEPHLGKVLEAIPIESDTEINAVFAEEYWATPGNVESISEISNGLYVDKILYGNLFNSETNIGFDYVVDVYINENLLNISTELISELAVGVLVEPTELNVDSNIDATQFLNINAFPGPIESITELIGFYTQDTIIMNPTLISEGENKFDSLILEVFGDYFNSIGSFDFNIVKGLVIIPNSLKLSTDISFNLEVGWINIHAIVMYSNLSLGAHAATDTLIYPNPLNSINSLNYYQITDLIVRDFDLESIAKLKYLPDTVVNLKDPILSNSEVLYLLGDLKGPPLHTNTEIKYNFEIYYTKKPGHDYLVSIERLGKRSQELFSQKTQKTIGNGVDFPFKYDKEGLDTNAGLELINDSIEMILSTCKGSRFFEPEFGSNLCKMAFEPIDELFFERLKIEVVDALRKWEKRIKIKRVELSDKDENLINNGIVYIKIFYSIRNTQIEGNYVYPFRTKEFYERQ